ncbi:TetR/AcrR family transcriptional regulator [Faunimonas pinastri]|nr:TetR/AcrR family transcriptional regulator [Faunimonas pinastri]
METILEATAQILSEHGSERLTTNFLARKAGFSVGTIYQYFPNREAIVLALIARQREEVGRRIRSALENDQKRTAEEKIGQIVHVLHEAFNVHRMPHRRLVQALMRVAAAQGLPSPPHIAAQAIIEVWREAGEDAAQPPNESEAFVLSRSVIEVLRQATLESSPLLGTAEFEQAILRLVLGFLREAGAG